MPLWRKCAGNVPDAQAAAADLGRCAGGIRQQAGLKLPLRAIKAKLDADLGAEVEHRLALAAAPPVLLTVPRGVILVSPCKIFGYTLCMGLTLASKKIPASAVPFFQEYDADLLDLDAHAHLIIERLLAYGNRAEVRWPLETYGEERVRSWITQSGSGRLPKRRYHLWCFVFDLPEQNRPNQIWKH